MSRMSMRLSVAESGLRVQPNDFKLRVSNLVDETLESLESIWNEAGYEEGECQGLLGDILTKFKTLCSAELSAEQQILEHAKNQVLAKFNEYEKFCAMLDRTCVKYDSSLGDNYAERLSRLEKMICDIEVEVLQRQDLLNAKRAEVSHLAHTLGEELPPNYDGGNDYCELADIRIEIIEDFRKKLDEIKDIRKADIAKIAADIRKCLMDLAVPKEGVQNLSDYQEYEDFDSILLKSDDLSAFGYHQDNLKRLTLRLKSLHAEKERRKLELSNNGAEIARMWTLLRIPQADRVAFQNSFEMNLSMATLARGREELARLKRLRMESLGTVVGSLREEIVGYLHELGISGHDQIEQQFPLFTCPIEDLDDAGVEQHEVFCASLKGKVEQLRPILLRIAKREAVVEERIELEHLMTNPERLTARGPKAREDRKREEEMQRRVKNLEKMTKEVLTHIALWEEANEGQIFLYGGEKYTDRIDAQEEFYVECRNTLRNQRKKKENKESSATAIATTPNNRVSKKAATAPPSIISNLSSKPGKEKCVLTPSTTTAGIVPSHTNILSNSLKLKGKVPLSTENLRNLNDSCELYSESGEADEGDIPEIDAHSVSSDCSDETEYTSMTEIKDRASTCTLVRNP